MMLFNYINIVLVLALMSCSQNPLSPKEPTIKLTDGGKRVKIVQDLHVLVGCRMVKELEIGIDEPSNGPNVLRNAAAQIDAQYMANPMLFPGGETGKPYMAKGDAYRCKL